MRYKRPKIKDDNLLRKKANEGHRTFQSRTETERKGWMKQWVVNKILGLYGDK